MKLTACAMGLALYILAGAGSTSAESLICPDGIVSTGDTTYEVLKQCGEPLFIESWEEGRHDGPRIRKARFHYTIGGWDREFLFRNGILIDIAY